MAEQEQADVTVEDLLAEIGGAEKAPEPGTLSRRDIIFSGDDDLPAPMVAEALKSAGWVYIYDTRTHERSICNRNMLPDTLKKLREDGSRAFTTRKPTEKAARGTLKCMLHPDGADRARYDTWGLPTCNKSNLSNPFEVSRHMQMRHKAEWATMQADQAQIEKAQEQAFRQALIQQATK